MRTLELYIFASTVLVIISFGGVHVLYKPIKIPFKYLSCDTWILVMLKLGWEGDYGGRVAGREKEPT